MASTKAVDLGKQLAADALEAPLADIEYRAGRHSVMGSDLGIELFELAGRQPGAHIHVDATNTTAGPSWPNGCHVVDALDRAGLGREAERIQMR